VSNTQKKQAQANQNKSAVKPVANQPKYVKPPKPKGLVPASYKPKQNTKPELVSDNLEHLFRGFCGLYDLGNGVCVAVRKINPEKDTRAIFVHSAPQGNILSCAPKDMYVLVRQLHMPRFESGLSEGSNKRAIQEFFFHILNDALIAQGVKEPPHAPVVKLVEAPVAHVVKTEQKAMAHADDATLSVILAGTPGKYVLGKGEDRIVLAVYEIHPRRLGKGHKTAVLAVEVMEINSKHPLFGKVAKGTFVPHDLITNGKTLNHAGCQALLAFLKPK